MPSFDIVSEVNKVELKNAVDQANKEIANRFDFKGSDARIEQAELVLTLYADDDFKLKQVTDVFLTKCANQHRCNFRLWGTHKASCLVFNGITARPEVGHRYSAAVPEFPRLTAAQRASDRHLVVRGERGAQVEHQLRVGFLTFYALKERLEQPTAVDNRGNQNPLCLDAVDDAIAVYEPLAD